MGIWIAPTGQSMIAGGTIDEVICMDCAANLGKDLGKRRKPTQQQAQEFLNYIIRRRDK